MRPPALVARAVLLGWLAWASGFHPTLAWAQDVERIPEKAAVRLRYGLTQREGSQTDLGPGLSYDGRSPNDLSLWASAYVNAWLGAWLNVQREAFGLFEGDTPITSGSLARFSVGPAARLQMGPLQGELAVGYAMAQLPLFNDSANPVFSSGTRHAAWVGARVLLPLFLDWRAELRGEVPFALSVTEPAGGDASSKGFSAGGALLIPLTRPGRWLPSAVLDYQFVDDAISVGDTVSRQRLHRFGVALEIAYGGGVKTAPAPLPGGVRLFLVDAVSQAPLSEAKVQLQVGEQRFSPEASDEQGAFRAEAVAAGAFSYEVTAPGYVPLRGSSSVEAGQERVLNLSLKKEPPKTGDLRVRVTNSLDDMPLKGATVKVGTEELKTDERGSLLRPGLPPGPLEVKVFVPQFRPSEEVVLIASSQRSELVVKLTPIEQRLLSTLSGLVRSAVGGKPVKALLEIPSLPLRVTANAKGAFSVQIAGGTYKVIISAKGYRTQSKTVTVRDGDQAIFNVDLFPSGR